MKEEKDQAPYYENPNGLHVDYKQQFVRAPMSLHPPQMKPKMGEFKGSYAMKICLGE